jgi:DUF1707 SHOCT-like domain
MPAASSISGVSEQETAASPDPARAAGLGAHQSTGREGLRAADVDRQFVAERLKAGVDEGRLSLYEYDERLQQTYAAKTYGDLDRVLLDLPGPASARSSTVVPAPAAAGSQPVPVAEQPVGRSIPRWLSAIWGAWIIAVSVNVVIWLLVSLSAGKAVYFWPMWVAGPWGAVLLVASVNGLLHGEPHRFADRAERRAAGRPSERRAARRSPERGTRRREQRRQRRYQRRGY